MAKEILSAQHARDEKEKLEKIISKLKLPLLISAVCSVVFYFVMYLTVNEILGTDFISQAIMLIGFAAVAGMLLTTITWASPLRTLPRSTASPARCRMSSLQLPSRSAKPL